MRAFELIRDMPMLERGAIFVFDEKNLSKLGSPGSGCLILAWDSGNCQKGWCGATFVLPGQCAKDPTWFVEVENPRVKSARVELRYYVNITRHSYSRTE